MTIDTLAPVALPAALDAYFAAQNAHDSDALAACFTPDALVHDEGEDQRGTAQIRAWAAATSARYQAVAEPLSLVRSDDVATVRARVSGTFPGSPVELDFRFTLAADGRIASLRIG